MRMLRVRGPSASHEAAADAGIPIHIDGARLFNAAVEQATAYRRMVGGAMRQAGVIAAAGIVALERMVERLADDHRRARDASAYRRHRGRGGDHRVPIGL